ncbi:hypothetical protein [Streptomyces reticuliscabiei]|uniref:hypothetical protein n=1 Tax=Streptomyces reticuliscabiei TaxID=146821 RepID=UPI00117D842D|nr:hypothetical protein [Streptomyces reticuliscabiei]
MIFVGGAPHRCAAVRLVVGVRTAPRSRTGAVRGLGGPHRTGAGHDPVPSNRVRCGAVGRTVRAAELTTTALPGCHTACPRAPLVEVREQYGRPLVEAAVVSEEPLVEFRAVPLVEFGRRRL